MLEDAKFVDEYENISIDYSKSPEENMEYIMNALEKLYVYKNKVDYVVAPIKKSVEASLNDIGNFNR